MDYNTIQPTQNKNSYNIQRPTNLIYNDLFQPQNLKYYKNEVSFQYIIIYISIQFQITKIKT